MKLLAPPSRTPAFFAAIAVALVLSLAVLDVLSWHRGLGFPDEWDLPLQLQQWKEGIPLPFSYAKGCLQRDSLWLASRCFGPSLFSLHLPLLLLFPFENFFLYQLAKRYSGPRAGAWAVLANCLAAFTCMRVRSVLTYSFLPFELLGLLWLLPLLSGAWAGLAWGFAAGIMPVEYEAWLVGLPVLGLAILSLERPSRPRLGPLLAGLSCGLAAVFLASRADLAGHVAVRASQNLSHDGAPLLSLWWQGLKGYGLGAQVLGYTGVQNTPAFPRWAWPALALGLWLSLRRGRLGGAWLPAWVLLGLLPLCSLNSAAEPQRAIVAWPGLCLLFAAGASWLQERGRLFLWALALLACLGAASELHAYLASIHQHYGEVYGASEAVEEAGQIALARSAGKPWSILTEFDNEPAAALRYMLPQPKAGPAGLKLALLPREYCLKKNSLQGIWLALPDQGPCLLEPDAPTWARLQKVDAQLGALWAGLPRYDRSQRRRYCLAFLASHPKSDPWVRTAVLEQVFGASFLLGEMPLNLLKRVEHEKLASASILLWSATKLQNYDPAWSERLLKRAIELDPRWKRP